MGLDLRERDREDGYRELAFRILLVLGIWLRGVREREPLPPGLQDPS